MSGGTRGPSAGCPGGHCARRDRQYSDIAMTPRSPDLAIFVLIDKQRQTALPLAHAHGVIRSKAIYRLTAHPVFSDLFIVVQEA